MVVFLTINSYLKYIVYHEATGSSQGARRSCEYIYKHIFHCWGTSQSNASRLLGYYDILLYCSDKILVIFEIYCMFSQSQQTSCLLTQDVWCNTLVTLKSGLILQYHAIVAVSVLWKKIQQVEMLGSLDNHKIATPLTLHMQPVHK